MIKYHTKTFSGPGGAVCNVVSYWHARTSGCTYVASLPQILVFCKRFFDVFQTNFESWAAGFLIRASKILGTGKGSNSFQFKLIFLCCRWCPTRTRPAWRIRWWRSLRSWSPSPPPPPAPSCDHSLCQNSSQCFHVFFSAAGSSAHEIRLNLSSLDESLSRGWRVSGGAKMWLFEAYACITGVEKVYLPNGGRIHNCSILIILLIFRCVVYINIHLVVSTVPRLIFNSLSGWTM